MRKLSPAELTLVRHLVTGSEPPERGAPVDWELVLLSAGYHHLGPLLHEGLKRSRLCLSRSVLPSDGVAELANALRDTVPRHLARKLARLDPVTGLSSDPKRATRPPFQHLLWARDVSSTLSLLIEVLGPRGGPIAPTLLFG